MIIEIDDYVPVPRKGRKDGSKNRVSSEKLRLLGAARTLVANGSKKINAAYQLDVEAKLNMKAESFAKLI